MFGFSCQKFRISRIYNLISSIFSAKIQISILASIHKNLILWQKIWCLPQCEALPTDIFNQIFKWFFDVISYTFFQLNRTVLHYAARCPNEATRTEIIDEMIMNGADKFAKDAFGNDAEYYFTHELNTNKQLAVGSNDKPNGASNGQTDDEVFDDSSPVIESAIQDKNFDKLVKYVLEGDSERLSGRSSEDEEIKPSQPEERKRW